jgi:hypothetical protein
MPGDDGGGNANLPISAQLYADTEIGVPSEKSNHGRVEILFNFLQGLDLRWQLKLARSRLRP